MQKLKIIPVPWEFITAAQCLTLHIVEPGCEDDLKGNANSEFEVRVRDSGPRRFARSRVRVNFYECVIAEFVKSFEPLESFDRTRFDVSELWIYKSDESKGVDIDSFKDELIMEWDRMGYSPTSRFYEVLDSELLKSTGLVNEFRHFILDGGESYLELVAQNFDWSFVPMKPVKR